jgi:hypothetical protein
MFVVELYEEEDKAKAKNVGKHILHCTFGGSSHYGLCDLGTAVNVVPYELYMEIQDELEPAFGNTDMLIIPLGYLCDKLKILLFVLLHICFPLTLH